MLVGVCGYGHAALNTELQISGEATVKPTAKTFGIQYMQDMTSAICAKAADVTDWQPTYEYKYVRTGDLAYDATTRTYDAHYLLEIYISLGRRRLEAHVC